MTVESQLLTALLKAADIGSENWRRELEECGKRLTDLMRVVNIPGTYPDAVWIMVDTQILGNGLKAPVVLHDENHELLPAFANIKDAESQARLLNLEVLKLPIA